MHAVEQNPNLVIPLVGIALIPKLSIHLSTTGFNINIKPEDYICSTCYKLHLSILKGIEENTNSPDSVLRDSIEIWRVKLVDTDTDELTRAVLITVIFVAEHILHQKAVLLPLASKYFREEYTASAGDSSSLEEINLEVGDSSIQFSSRWLLHQLIIYLEPHMSYKCIHKKFGTILYRKGGDLLTALSWALGSSHANTCKTQEEQQQSRRQTGFGDPEYRDRLLDETGHIINDLIHSEIRRLQRNEHANDPKRLIDWDLLIQHFGTG